MAFLRMVEGGFAQIDGLVTNPDESKENRHLGNDIVTDRLIKKAEEFGLKGICSFSVDDNTVNRAKKHGFQVLNHKVFFLDLRTKIQ